MVASPFESMSTADLIGFNEDAPANLDTAALIAEAQAEVPEGDAQERGFFGKVAESWRRGWQSPAADVGLYEAIFERRWSQEDALSYRNKVRRKDVVDPILKGTMFSRGGYATVPERMVYGAARMIPLWLQSAFASKEEIVQGTTLGAGVALAAGQAGPQALMPEEVLTVPAGAAIGAVAGFTAGSAMYMYKQGVGEMLGALYDKGIDINDPKAKIITGIAGVPYAALEFFQAKQVTPGLRKGLQKVMQTTALKILAKAAKRYGKDLSIEVLQEVGQEAVMMMAEDAVDYLDDHKVQYDKNYFMERMARLGDTGVNSLVEMALLLGGGMVQDVSTGMYEVQAANKAASTTQLINEEIARLESEKAQVVESAEQAAQVPVAEEVAAAKEEVAPAPEPEVVQEARAEAGEVKQPWEMTQEQQDAEGWIEVWRQDRVDVPKGPFVEGKHWGTLEQAKAIAEREKEAGRSLGELHHAYIQVKNPLVTYDGGFWQKPVAEAKAKGYDSVTYLNEGEKVGGMSYIPLSKDQIKPIPVDLAAKYGQVEQAAEVAPAPPEATVPPEAPVETAAQAPQPPEQPPVPAEPVAESPEGERVIGIANAITTARRAELGMEEAERGAPMPWPEALIRAEATRRANPNAGLELIADVQKNPERPLSAEENMLLTLELARADNAVTAAAQGLRDAEASGNAEAIAAAREVYNRADDQFRTVTDATKLAGTPVGQSLNIRKAMLRVADYTLARMKAAWIAVTGGETMTRETERHIEDVQQQIAKVEQAVDESAQKTGERKTRTEAQAMRTLRRQAKVITRENAGVVRDKAIKAIARKAEKQEIIASDISAALRQVAKSFIAEGISERDALVDAVHAVADDLVPGITRREVADALSGYGKYKLLSKDDIEVRLRAVVGELQQLSKLEDIGAGEAPLKTGIERRTPSAEETALIRRVNIAKREGEYVVIDPARQLRTALDARKKYLQTRATQLQEKLDKKDFAPRARPEPIQLDEEGLKIQAQVNKLKLDWQRELLREKHRRRTVPQKVWFGVRDSFNVARLVMTSFDLSAILRQGGFIAFGHPIRAYQQLGPMWQALKSDEGAGFVTEQIRQHPLYAESQKAGLFLSSWEAGLTEMEEATMSAWAMKIPGIAHSARAYTTFLNTLRFDSFVTMTQTMGRDGFTTPNEQKAIANYINVATGRSSLKMGGGTAGDIAIGMNSLFFAPRYLASRFEVLAGQPLWRGTARTRKMVAKEYGRLAIGLAMFYTLALLAGGKTEVDPRSSDFGKLRFGRTRLDPLMGLSQIMVLLTRVAGGKTKTAKGEVQPLRPATYGKRNVTDVMVSFLRTKASPIVGQSWDWLAGETYIGEDVTPVGTLKSFSPMSMRDAWQAMAAEGVPKGFALGFLSFIGMGLNTYDESPEAMRQTIRLLERQAANEPSESKRQYLLSEADKERERMRGLLRERQEKENAEAQERRSL